MSDFDDYTIIASRGWPILSDHGMAGETAYSRAGLSALAIGTELQAHDGRTFRKIEENRWSGEPTTENDQ